MKARTFAALHPKAALEPHEIRLREPRPHDVVIDIHFSGVCHSDIHQAREEWFTSIFPMVPGHEIAGVVRQTGDAVTRYRVGDRVGVGVFVDSCRTCRNCQRGLENYCQVGSVSTYNGKDYDGNPTYGGYADSIIADEKYVLRIPDALELAAAAPLLCAGITTYAPLRHAGCAPGMNVGIIGLGGLGHMGVQHAHAMGASVTLFSHSPAKEEDARRLGADDFVLLNDAPAMKDREMNFDFIVNTASASMDLNPIFNLLSTDGTLCYVGLPEQPLSVNTFALIGQRRNVSGSMVGGLTDIQDMLDFCADHNYASQVEVISAAQINEAWDRVVASDVRYRFVIDASSF